MLVAIVIVWYLCGAAIALAMVRRGHSPFLWWILIPFGPLLGLVALSARDEEAGFRPVVSHAGAVGTGSLHALVGIDGKSVADDAVIHALPRLGPLLGRLTFATVLDYDIGQLQEADLRIEEAEILLEQAATRARAAGLVSPQTVVLVGDPVEELCTWADGDGVDVLVVANHSHGRPMHAVAGSVARGLLSSAPCPVVVVPVAVATAVG
jgi:nucleotide-binding universal stress UspA family protein